MFDKILPQQIDNIYRGQKPALWLFALVVSLKLLQGLMLIFNGHSTLVSADGVPLDTFPPAAAQTILAIWALSGLERVLLSSLCLLALVRYRSLVTFMFGLLAVDYLARQLILYFIPIVRTGTPAGPIVNLVFFFLMIVGLALSLWNRRTSDEYGRQTRAA